MNRFTLLVLLPLALTCCSQAQDTLLSADALYTEILQQYVNHRGLVDYESLKEDKRLDQYLAVLAQTNPKKLPSENAQKAFWINVYNAYTLKLIAANYPVETITELHKGGALLGYITGKTAWDLKFVSVNNTTMSLNHVEHKILRKDYNDFRIHFALVCAARSCPPLRHEAYTAERLDEQLDNQAQIFLSNIDKNRFDTERKLAEVSMIFKWFKDDFGDDTAKRLLALAPYLPSEAATSIKHNIAKWRMKYLSYDWNLNTQL